MNGFKKTGIKGIHAVDWKDLTVMYSKEEIDTAKHVIIDGTVYERLPEEKQECGCGRNQCK